MRISGGEHADHRPVLIVERDHRPDFRAGELAERALAHDQLAQTGLKAAPLDYLHLRPQRPDGGTDAAHFDIRIGPGRTLRQVRDHHHFGRCYRTIPRVTRHTRRLRNQCGGGAIEPGRQFVIGARAQHDRRVIAARLPQRGVEACRHGQQRDQYADHARDTHHDHQGRAEPLRQRRQAGPGDGQCLFAAARQQQPGNQQQARNHCQYRHGHPDREHDGGQNGNGRALQVWMDAPHR